MAKDFENIPGQPKPLPESSVYWIKRYESGRNSGDGSYNRLAEFKAEILNEFVQKNEIATVIEYGCGDGNRLRYAKYQSYTGFDISAKAISLCKTIFQNDSTKTFRRMREYNGETAELTLSLDVIYHLVEFEVFLDYMNRLFESAKRYVVIYSSDTDENAKGQAAHVWHRKFTKWVELEKPEWQLASHIPNKYPYAGDTRTGSSSDFFIYKRA